MKPLHSTLLAATMLAVAWSTPAMAEGKADRAKKAIAVAEAKISAADTAGADTLLAVDQAKAKQALADAREDLSAGRKEEAIETANHAAMIADANLGQAQRMKAQHTAARVEAAKTDAAIAQAQASEATQQAAAQQVAAANERAANAEQAAQAAQQEAMAARASAQAAMEQKAAVETTVTTQNTGRVAARKVVRTRVVKKPAHSTRVAGPVATTTTTVTQRVN
ncbi:hypothetical protein [Novosphingobium humi]|uniref:hypothetical protein n=1 Tax=Novosphingobium humi TaxID=2282397 RepID=UPI0025AF1500|nr:hypothetical protein [Novosphingobium humi]WJS97166.1 hypothetical protein NYQ05_08260 [Novosphingobium humi]